MVDRLGDTIAGPPAPAGRGWAGGLSNHAALDSDARGRLKPSVEDIGIEVNLTGPLDRLRLRVDPHFFEQFAALADRLEHTAARQHIGYVDVLHRAVRKPDSQPRPLPSLSTSRPLSEPTPVGAKRNAERARAGASAWRQ